MALLDAVTKTLRTPLYRFLGGATDRVETDISVPIVPPARASELAAGIAAEGVRVIKLKVGSGLIEDFDRTMAVANAAPHCDITLDANQGYTAAEAVELVRRLNEKGVRVRMFEQPVARHDHFGMKFVSEHSPIPVAADETVACAADALRVAAERSAHIVNVKLMKSGLVEAMDIVAVCKAGNLGLMIGGMIETRLAMCCSAHYTAGLGGFGFVNLDTPLLLAEDPFDGGYRRESAMLPPRGHAQPASAAMCSRPPARAIGLRGRGSPLFPEDEPGRGQRRVTVVGGHGKRSAPGGVPW